jgi:hypothetical protein
VWNADPQSRIHHPVQAFVLSPVRIPPLCDTGLAASGQQHIRWLISRPDAFQKVFRCKKLVGLIPRSFRKEKAAKSRVILIVEMVTSKEDKMIVPNGFYNVTFATARFRYKLDPALEPL